MIRAQSEGSVPVVVGVQGMVISTVSVEHWRILDDERMLFGVVVWDRRVSAEIYAERVAALLEEHGLLELDA